LQTYLQDRKKAAENHKKMDLKEKGTAAMESEEAGAGDKLVGRLLSKAVSRIFWQKTHIRYSLRKKKLHPSRLAKSPSAGLPNPTPARESRTSLDIGDSAGFCAFSIKIVFFPRFSRPSA
jgi:hypothetical protein